MSQVKSQHLLCWHMNEELHCLDWLSKLACFPELTKLCFVVAAVQLLIFFSVRERPGK